ncbi:restriction endonuclease [Arundinibacter roseus]|uniref:Restriction endonuclease n=1 Tax=Arundinibacter roseus TaxID=2070510 RepID=A0A4R4K7K0_9BACT|nr:restriction endonuclease [Arundinibacter roseus]
MTTTIQPWKHVLDYGIFTYLIENQHCIKSNEIFKERSKSLNFVKPPECLDSFLKNESINSTNEIFQSEIEKSAREYNIDLKILYDNNCQLINQSINDLKVKYQKIEESWNLELKNFVQQSKEYKDKIDILKNNYFKHDQKSIREYHHLILQEIVYDKYFLKSITVDYIVESKILIIEYLLPTIEQFPKIKEIKFLKTKNELKEIIYSERELDKLYNDIIYRIVLDLIRISFNVDEIDAIKCIVFNGWSNAINRATGNFDKACILSVVSNKDEFARINLAEVDPKECFKKLKGISASNIKNQTPINPIMSIDSNDKRFISSKEIEINSFTNLASMNWEDFEHLIRELFEKEFSVTGGEVKVTQSSRDGGVDAIVFDPDPIRGGKIVIQAKRYTNLVGVSSVRDLYGTVMNEGATKGILVTTSDYGPDSFKFAKDKPITLINGGHLLFLLEKHGYNARINIKEAKEDFK